MKDTKEYLMILRNTDWDEGLAVEEIARVVDEYTRWFDRMLTEGKITGGRPLLSGGRVVGKEGGMISDGPFIESKEAIGGYIVVRAGDFDEAVEIVRTFPPVRLGVRVEIRELTHVCPISQRLEKRLAEA
ncbi:MAG: YciI family protein [Verrucomicrobiota bacterium]